jgi:GntR family transcriptional regulator
VAEGVAGLRIERVSYLPSGRVVEFTRSLYRGDAYDFAVELKLAPETERTAS